MSFLGITLGNETSMYCDGMRKHCFAFYQQMECMNLNPAFLCTDTVYDWLSKDYPKIQKVKYSDIKKHTFKCVIEWEVYLPDPTILHNRNIKCIRMNCGNMFHSSHIRFI
jgi:hypothetical protein